MRCQGAWRPDSIETVGTCLDEKRSFSLSDPTIFLSRPKSFSPNEQLRHLTLLFSSDKGGFRLCFRLSDTHKRACEMFGQRTRQMVLEKEGL
jgi:hypothetical protein